jgi:hypothetical protein
MIRSPRERKEWAAHQVETSQGDYAPTSVLWGAPPPLPQALASPAQNAARPNGGGIRHHTAYAHISVYRMHICIHPIYVHIYMRMYTSETSLEPDWD